jgi:hypothetical protein
MRINRFRRRAFITLVGGAAAAWPLGARAQQAAKPPTIGFLGANTPSAQSQWTAAFVQRLRELGWIEGRTIAIEYRWAEGRTERFAELATEFVRLKVDVIVTLGAAVAAAKQATSVIPVDLRQTRKSFRVIRDRRLDPWSGLTPLGEAKRGGGYVLTRPGAVEYAGDPSPHTGTPMATVAGGRYTLR